MNSKYVDNTSILQVIACIYLNPNILGYDDKYSFSEEDFPDEFHKIVFGSIYNLYQLGAKSISILNITDYLSSRPKSEAIFKANKGEEWLLQIKEAAIPSAFDYYYSRLKKMTLLRMYDNYGVDVSFIYDPDNILDVKKKQQQEDWLDNSSLEDIVEKIDNRIDEIKLRYVDNSDIVTHQAGEDIMELIQRLKDTPEVGIPMYGPLINTITRGARLKKLYLRSGATGTGKALPNDIIIPTPNGYKKVGEIKAGDYLFDAFGKPTKVMQIFPQGEKEVWEITFKDGRTAKCSKDHLWSYCSEGQKSKSKENRMFMTDTLENISKKPLYKKGHGYQILIPMQKAVEYEEKDFYLKPYSMGLLLGDGSFRYTKQQKALEYSSENEILPKAIAEEMDWEVNKTSDFNYNWIFRWKNKEREHRNVWVEEALKDYPDLWNLKSDKKFIPKEYLRASIKQRRELLNGLLDSDGSVNEKGKISYYTNSSQLKDDILELCYSLGLKATYQEDKHKDTFVVYVIHITSTPEDKALLFKLPRKKKLIEEWCSDSKRKEYNLFNPIVKIEKLNYSTEMTCFLVDNEEHLFLMNDFIVTHNTRTMVADACNFACNKIYDETFGWIKNGTKEPTLFITTEQEKEEIQTMMLAFLSNVQEENIIKGRYEEGEEERVIEAAKILQDSPLYIEELPDFSLKDIENRIKKNIREHDVRYVLNPKIKGVGQ